MTLPVVGENRVATCREVVALVAKRIPSLSSNLMLVQRQLAAAALARCNRLELAILDLTDHGYPDATGALLRPLAEVGVTGLYLLYGGHDAWTKVAANHIHWLRQFPDDEDFQEMHKAIPDWDGPARPINWTATMKEVGELLEEQVPGGRAAAQAIRLILYKGTSLVDVHGGFQPIAGHLVDADSRWDLASTRRDDGDPYTNALMGAVVLGAVASHVLEAFGFGTRDVDALMERLGTPDSGV
jgi:hypothetical protein